MPEHLIWKRFFRRHWFSILLVLFVLSGLGSIFFPNLFPDWFRDLIDALAD